MDGYLRVLNYSREYWFTSPLCILDVQQLVSEPCPLNEPNSLKEILNIEHMTSKTSLKEFLGECQLYKDGELKAALGDLEITKNAKET